jgi:hypothetical protein
MYSTDANCGVRCDRGLGNGMIRDEILSDFPELTKEDIEACIKYAIENPAAVIKGLAKPRPHLPKDFALNHGHYVRGEPRKC